MLRLIDATLLPFCLGVVAAPWATEDRLRVLALLGLAALLLGLDLLVARGAAAEGRRFWIALLALGIGIHHGRPEAAAPLPELRGSVVEVEARVGAHRILGGRTGSPPRLRLTLLEPRLLPERARLGPALPLLLPGDALLPPRGASIRVRGWLEVREGRARLEARGSEALRPTEEFATRLRGSFDRLRRRLEGGLEGRASPRLAALLRSLLFGAPFAIEEDAESMRRAGAAHLLVVSGLHVALLARLLGSALGAGRSGARAALLLAALAGYAALAGGRPPVLRALLVWMLYALGRRVGRPVDLGRAVVAVAAFLLVADPALGSDPSFQLSFAALGGIAGLGRPLLRGGADARERAGLRERLRGARSGLAVAWGALAGTAPVSLATFGTVAPAGLITGLLLWPLAALILLGGPVALALPDLLPLLEPPAAVLLEAAGFVGRIPGSRVNAVPTSASIMTLVVSLLVGARIARSAAASGDRGVSRRLLGSVALPAVALLGVLGVTAVEAGALPFRPGAKSGVVEAPGGVLVVPAGAAAPARGLRIHLEEGTPRRVRIVPGDRAESMRLGAGPWRIDLDGIRVEAAEPSRGEPVLLVSDGRERALVLIALDEGALRDLLERPPLGRIDGLHLRPGVAAPLRRALETWCGEP